MCFQCTGSEVRGYGLRTYSPRTARKSGEIKKKGCVTDAGRSQSAMRKVWYRPEAERCQKELAALSTRADSAAGSFLYSMSSDNTTEHPAETDTYIVVLPLSVTKHSGALCIFMLLS